MFALQKPDNTILHNLIRVHDNYPKAIPKVSDAALQDLTGSMF